MEDTTTPPVSPSDTEEVKEEIVDQPGKKSAEARINELLSEVKSREDKLRELEEKIEQRAVAPQPPVQENPTMDNPELQKAVKMLKDAGMASQEDLVKMQRDMESRNSLNSAHARNEQMFSGSDGRPKYDRSKVEDFMRSQGVWNPEAAYKLMHEAELLDYELKKRGQTKDAEPRIRPGSSDTHLKDNTISRETISEWLKTPEGRMKYEKNREKILKLAADQQL